MIYDLSKNIDLEQYNLKTTYLAEKGKRVELKEIRMARSVSQNNYLHVCISMFAVEFGYTIDEAKTLLKRNCDFMRYEKNKIQFLKKTSLMDSKQLTDFIDWLRNFASIHGLYIPTSEEYKENKFSIDKAIDGNRGYL